MSLHKINYARFVSSFWFGFCRITESGLTSGVSKRGPNARKKTLKEMVIFDPNEEETDDDEEVLLDKKRESSHDFD